MAGELDARPWATRLLVRRDHGFVLDDFVRSRPARKRMVMEVVLSFPRGRPYQQLVADIARAFDPGAAVTENEWVAGPDGRLDMDVAIRGALDGRPILAVIECKDFNVASTGKVGREYVDALDSKRHDLGANIALICSNSGFTTDALKKAKRKGIGMISVLRAGDDKVKAVIEETIFLRTIKFAPWRFTYRPLDDTLPPLPVAALHDLRFEGGSVHAWLQNRALLVACANPTVTRPLRASFKFVAPQLFSCGEREAIVSGVEVGFSYTTEWRCQTVRLDAALGLYDYLRRRVRSAPGKNTYTIRGVEWDTATPCEPPGAPPPAPSKDLVPGEMDVAIIFTEGLDMTAGPQAPDLERYVIPEDLSTRIPEDTPLHDQSSSR